MATTTKAAAYTLYIVRFATNDHRPYLVGNNGKVVLNESVSRAAKLQHSMERFTKACKTGKVATVRIGVEAFRKRFPSFAPNAGGKKKPVEFAPGAYVQWKGKVTGTQHKGVVVQAKGATREVRITYPHTQAGRKEHVTKADLSKA